MKKLFLFVLPLLLISCKKEETNPNVETFQRVVGKYLVCDSVKTTVNGIKTTEKFGKGTGRDMRFSLYATFTIYSTPEDVWNFQMEAPNKIFYWKAEYAPDQFYTILSNTTTKLLLQQAFTDSVIVNYFTIEPL